MATAVLPADNARRAILAGASASLLGIGLARFAYTPLIPALIAEHWFAPGAAAYLGAANLAGYLAGALLARRLATMAPAAAVLRAMMLLATAAFLACSQPLGFAWYFVWRFGAGIAGGVLMALAAPTVLAAVPAHRRGLAGGAIFTGVGLGIAASGTLVPLLQQQGLAATWLGLGLIAAMLTAAAWFGWPEAPKVALVAAAHRTSSPPLRALYLEYALNAVGLVPHMVLLVDFVARGLGEGSAAGARIWVLFGVGALIGPLAAGWVADRIGFRAALRLAFVLQAIAILPAALGGPWVALSSVIVGACVPGVVPLALGRANQLAADPAARGRAWTLATAAFALGQAAAGYGFSFLFAAGVGYAMIFALASAALIVALCIDLVVRSR